MSQPAIIARSAEKANVWLDELADQLGTDDRAAAYRVLRAFLHALRDRLPVNEAAQLSAQLPELIRGIYFEGWRPSATPESYSHLEPFLERVRREALLDGDTEASFATEAAATVLRRHVSRGEIEDVIANLPAALRPLLDPGP